MKATALKIEGLPSRKVLIILLAIVLTVGAGWGLWKYVSTSSRPSLVRWRVTRYLKKQSIHADFKVAFPFPSREQMDKAPPNKSPAADAMRKGTLTGKDFETLKSEYIQLRSAAILFERKIASGKDKFEPDLKAKEEALAPITSDLWEFQHSWLAELNSEDARSAGELNAARLQLGDSVREQLTQAGSYAAIYRAIGQELWLAQKLLASANPQFQRIGMSLALEASQISLDDAQNGWLAGRICEGYIWPHLDLADDRNRRSPFYTETLLTDCANIFRQNDELENVTRTYEFLLTKIPERADWAHAQLGMAFDQAGDARRALGYLQSIRATNDFPWVTKRIARLERQIKRN